MTEIIEESNSLGDALKTQIAQRRIKEELRGVEYRGIRWYADNAGRQAVTETLVFADIFEAQHGPDSFSTEWKGMHGQWADNVTKAALLQVGLLLGQRRAACFARERALLAEVDADPDAFDVTLIGAGWPT